eukprot:scaffold80430_cov18-Prasinocladus_malaysianus.AAC.1
MQAACDKPMNRQGWSDFLTLAPFASKQSFNPLADQMGASSTKFMSHGRGGRFPNSGCMAWSTLPDHQTNSDCL